MDSHSEYMKLVNQDLLQRPTATKARVICKDIPLDHRPLDDPRLQRVLTRLKETHVNGGAVLASFHVGLHASFDWLASKGRLLEFGMLRLLLDRSEVSQALPELKIKPSSTNDPAFATQRLGDGAVTAEHQAVLERSGLSPDYEVSDAHFDGTFKVTSSFLFHGELAQKLYHGGAYTPLRTTGGKQEMESALAFCDALFGSRFAEVFYFTTHEAWTPFFGGVSSSMDWTAVLYDPAQRALSILAVGDSD